MMRRTVITILTFAAVIAAALALSPETAFAQCPLCKSALESSGAGAGVAKTLNLGILVLLVPPVTIFCTIFAVAFRKHRAAGGRDEE